MMTENQTINQDVSQELKNEISFVDADNNIVKAEIEIKYKEENQPVFTMSGSCKGSSGQCFDHVTPRTEAQKELIKLWKENHLNDMNAGCEHQRAADWDKVRIDPSELPTESGHTDKDGIIATWIRPDDHPKGLLTKPCPECGYRYGSAWLYRALPDGFRETLLKLIETIEAEEITHKQERIEASEITSFDDFENDKIVALAQSLSLEPQEAEDIEELSEDRYEYQGIEYFIGTEDETEEQAKAYLMDDPELWRMAVADGQTEESLEDWAKRVINSDGYGHLLNSWDGSEDYEVANGTGYFIIRSG